MSKDTGELIGFESYEEREAFAKANTDGIYLEIDPELLTEEEAKTGIIKNEEVRNLVAMLSNAESMTRQQKRNLLKKLKKARKKETRT